MIRMGLKEISLVSPAADVNRMFSFLFLGDPGSFLVQLAKGLKGHRCPEEWPQSLKAGDVTKESANR